MAKSPRPLVELVYGARDKIWREIRRAREFSITDLARAIKVPRGQIETYVRCLVRAGYLHKLEVKAVRQRLWLGYRLVRDIGVEAPHLAPDGTPHKARLREEQMWRTMKMIGRDFGILDILIGASTEAVPVSEVHAETYVAHLTLAGYVKVVGEHRSSLAPKRLMRLYRFDQTRYTGSRAPILERHCVYDQNKRRVVWQREPSK